MVVSDSDRGRENSKIHSAGTAILHAQTRAIDRLIAELHELDTRKEDMSVRVPLLMLQAVGVSVHSIITLTKERGMAIRDCYGIARSTVETAINAAFVAASGPAMAEKAVRHMRQKRWRDLQRQGVVGETQITVSRNIDMTIDDHPGLSDALNEYTNKRGEEIRDWTSENLAKRIDAVAERNKRAGLCLSVAHFSIYRPASELVHGTFYGVNLFWQGSGEEPASKREEFEQLWIYEHFVTLLTAVFFGTSGAIEALAHVHSLANHAQLQDELSRKLSALIEFMSENDVDDEHEYRAEEIRRR